MLRKLTFQETNNQVGLSAWPANEAFHSSGDCHYNTLPIGARAIVSRKIGSATKIHFLPSCFMISAMVGRNFFGLWLFLTSIQPGLIMGHKRELVVTIGATSPPGFVRPYSMRKFYLEEPHSAIVVFLQKIKIRFLGKKIVQKCNELLDKKSLNSI